MSLADDLLKLEAMKNAGSLTDSEFEDAKRVLLRDADAPTVPEPRDAISPPAPTLPATPAAPASPDAAALGLAVNRYVDLKTREYNNGKVMGLIGVIIFVIVAIAICAGVSNGPDSDPMFPTGSCTFSDPTNPVC